MEITALGNCAATVLSQPMAPDEAALRRELEAAASAGFDAVSLWAFHVMFGGPHAVDIVRDSGLQVGAVEAAIGWTAGPGENVRGEIDGLVGVADDVGARIIGAACLGPIADEGAAADGLAQIAATAAGAGKVIALEFLPWTGVPTMAAADALIRRSGADNATILLDTFHWVRQPGGPDLDLLRSLPGDRIAYVQLCDPSPEASVPLDAVEEEAMHRRRLPGAGGVDHAGLWAALDHIGSTPFVAAEVFSDELLALGADEMARRVHDACRAVMP